MKNKRVLLSVIVAITAAFLLAAQEQNGAATEKLAKSVFDAIGMMPHYGVFDVISFDLAGIDVTLLGQVMLPISKVEAGRRVAKIAGIGKVTNQIEVLPLSRNDDAIRMKVYRSIFNRADLYKYAMGAIPAIHIIVKNGHVKLEGVVDTEMDSKLALAAAREVPGIFSVKSNIKVEK